MERDFLLGKKKKENNQHQIKAWETAVWHNQSHFFFQPIWEMVSVKQHRLLSMGMQRLGQSIPQGPILPTPPTATGVTPENRWDCLESEWKP